MRFRAMALSLVLSLGLTAYLSGTAFAIGSFDASNITVTSGLVQFNIGNLDRTNDGDHGGYDGTVIFSNIYCADTDSIVAATDSNGVWNTGDVVSYTPTNYDGSVHSNCVMRIYTNNGLNDYQSRQSFSIPTSTVPPVTLQSVEITPANSTIRKKDQQQFAAIGFYSDGSRADLTETTSWTSSNIAVAAISASGLATGEKKGMTTITAASGAVTGSTTLTVDQKKVHPKKVT